MGKEDNTNYPYELPSQTTTGITRRSNLRYPVDDQEQQPGSQDHQEVGCSGQSCRSCTAGVIADCVAVCCCPCAVVNIFTLTFLKLPWMIGRKCLGLGNKKKKKLKDQNGVSRKEDGLERKISEGLKEIQELQDEKDEYGARFEGDKVWLELYKVDHLGFGRVSIS
uniref:uncharacterized protein LOC122586342 n=1 Tax=Erigeron canadensis TaxID=72917 RepID=UPI001CB8D80E|nr:uncharacterized protein LOC122586342 [Erigeron canadensis]